MHVMRQVQDGWQVGYWYTDGVRVQPQWCAISTTRSKIIAARICNYLNGGEGHVPPDSII
jgi:hypothetical protein